MMWSRCAGRAGVARAAGCARARGPTSAGIRSGLTTTRSPCNSMKLKPPNAAAYWSWQAALDAEVVALDRRTPARRSRSRSAAAAVLHQQRRSARPSSPRGRRGRSPGGALECRNRSNPRVAPANRRIAALARSSLPSKTSGSWTSNSAVTCPKSTRLDRDLVVVARAQRAVRVAVDRRVEDEPALALGERRDVRAAAGEGDAQRRLGADQHERAAT